MSFVDFLKETNENIQARMELASEIQGESPLFSEEDAYIAAVHTRQDTSLNASINAYSARTLISIKYGVWAIVAIELARLVIAFL